ncbi:MULTISPECIES: FMN-binding glutamate synthase family protein [Neobacillus]|uniref:FMN-binding glutamate synthase family protein n=1 Tax=Neobacillus rhizophilus TaxID=2833579 RepID=A0A942U519_9BACI|nr:MULTISPECIES: FMN-binding glutamate synthase family protein [Neobacillus]MBS4214840.1 FMN-binding glutamate synthase family protein [Neobacillus rhizophilus]
MANILFYLTFALMSLLFVIILFMLIGWRWIMKRIVKMAGKIILSDSYQENIMELLPGLRHMGIQNVLENSLRAETGTVLFRPLGGSAKKWPHLEPITFIPAQTSPFPIDGVDEVDVTVTIGPMAKKPMKIEIPLMISGMGFGISLSEQARLSLAKAANKTGTAINSGQGGILPEELNAAGKYILQIAKTDWAKEDHLLKRADMIEIKLGQGALAGMGEKVPPQRLAGRALEVMGLKENEEAVIYENFFEDQTLLDLKQLVDELRVRSGGVPIGVKLGAGGKIEEDLDHLLYMGVDFITIDGGQAGMHGAPPILFDDFGIPTLHAVVRAVNHLEKRKMKGKISLIVSGGMLVPGHFLKVLALGADAVYVGTAMLFALAHDQVLNALPFEPPTQAIWYDGKFKDQFKTDVGEKTAEKFLTACTEEMKMALRSMGKRSLKELSKKDLVSYDELTARKVGIPFSFRPWEDKQFEN